MDILRMILETFCGIFPIRDPLNLALRFLDSECRFVFINYLSNYEFIRVSIKDCNPKLWEQITKYKHHSSFYLIALSLHPIKRPSL